MDELSYTKDRIGDLGRQIQMMEDIKSLQEGHTRLLEQILGLHQDLQKIREHLIHILEIPSRIWPPLESLVGGGDER